MDYDFRTPPQPPRRLPSVRLRKAGRPNSPSGEALERPLRSRHEAFCQYFVLGGNASHAARDAGYAPQSSHNQGYRLMRQPRIRARIAEIQGGLGHAFCLDQTVLMGKLEAVYQRAITDHNYHSAVRAVEMQARMAGLIKGPIPDGEKFIKTILKTINDDIPGPVLEQSPVESTPYKISGRRK